MDSTPKRTTRFRNVSWLLAFAIGAVLASSVFFDARSAPLTPAHHPSAAQRRMLQHYNAALLGTEQGVPPLARTRALQQARTMPSLAASAGTWTFVGPAGLTGAQGDDSTGACTITRIGASGRILSLGFGQ